MVLPQQICPTGHVEVREIMIFGRSQNAAIIGKIQKPGHDGSFISAGFVTGFSVVVVGSGFAGASVIQQNPSPGQSASVSILSQRNANRPLTHSPLQFSPSTGFGLSGNGVDTPVAGVVNSDDNVIGRIAAGGRVVNPIFSGILVVLAYFSSGRVPFNFVLSITSNSGGGESPNASRDTQHRYPDLQSVSTFNTASQ